MINQVGNFPDSANAQLQLWLQGMPLPIPTPPVEALRASMMSEGLCKQLTSSFFSRQKRGEKAAVLLRELMNEVYARGFASGVVRTETAYSAMKGR